MEYPPPYPQQPNSQPHQQPYQPQHGYPPPQHPIPYRPPAHLAVYEEYGLSQGAKQFNLTMTILTCGFWGLFVWLPWHIFRQYVPRRVSVKRYY